MEYVYSILERGRLAALSGDKLMAMPVFLDPGLEAWRAKEARTIEAETVNWGPEEYRGPAWEAITATDLLQGGADLLALRHPKAIDAVKTAIQELMGAAG
jgi:acetyl-CoA decarbonylase/synthase complex subunit delta